MLRVLIAKELHEIMSSTKFVIMVLCVSILCLATFLNGVNSFIESQENIKAGIQDSLNNLLKEDSYDNAAMKGYSVYLHLSPLAIYDYGIFRSYGLDSRISNSAISQLSPNPGIGFQGLNTLGFLDQVTIINSVFSLFAILFSYNLISGERQQGMLRIIFANSVSRNKLLLAKMIGAMLPLWMLVIIPILLGAISIQLFAGVNFDLASLLDLSQLLAVSLLYVSTFFLLGLLISCLTRKSFNSFLFSIVVWVLLVIVVPRFAVNIAQMVSPVDSADKIKNEKIAYSADTMKRMGSYYQEYASENKIKFAGWMMKLRDMMSYAMERMKADNISFEEKQLRKMKNQRNNFLRRVSLFSIVSPSASYVSASRRICRTHFEYIDKIEDELDKYRMSYTEYFDGKEDPDFFNPTKMMERMGVKFEKGEGGYLKVTSVANSKAKSLDLSGMPEFSGELKELEPDFGMLTMEYFTLMLMCLILILASVIVFQRYDVR